VCVKSRLTSQSSGGGFATCEEDETRVILKLVESHLLLVKNVNKPAHEVGNRWWILQAALYFCLYRGCFMRVSFAGSYAQRKKSGRQVRGKHTSRISSLITAFCLASSGIFQKINGSFTKEGRRAAACATARNMTNPRVLLRNAFRFESFKQSKDSP